MQDIILEVIEKSKHGNTLDIIYSGILHGYISLDVFKEMVEIIKRDEL